MQDTPVDFRLNVTFYLFWLTDYELKFIITVMDVTHKKRTEIMSSVLTNYTLPGFMSMLFVIRTEREKLHN